MTVQEGDVLAGKYRVDKVLGVGGMGVVVAGHHIQLDDRVAIKFMLPEALVNREAVARFAREARAAVRIKSEHVARVTDVGTLEDGAPYMVMEYLDGIDLSGLLKQRGALPIEQAVEFVLQASEAIAEAHTLGIVHRDLKPANLFVIRRPDGLLSVKVLDFGISKMSAPGAAGVDMTSTNAAMGSPLYMSPEQLQSAKDVDARSDIWALGIILYELLTNESPFNAETLPSVLLKIMSAQPPRLRDKRPDAPSELQEIVLRCLAKDREQRYQSIGAMALALVPFGPKRSRLSLERISGLMQTAGVSTSDILAPSWAHVGDEVPVDAGTAATWAKTASKTPRGKAVFGAAAGLLVLAASGGWLLRPKADPPGLPAPMTSQPPSAAATAPRIDAPPPVDLAASKTVAPDAPLASAASQSAVAPLPRAPATVHRSPLASPTKPVAPVSPQPAAAKPVAPVSPQPAAAKPVTPVSPQPAAAKPRSAMGGLIDDRR